MSFWPKSFNNDAKPSAQADPSKVNGSVAAQKPAEKPAAPNAASPVPQPELTDEVKRKGAQASKTMMAAFGEIVSVLMRAPQHKHRSLADLEWLAIPAVVTRQFAVAEAQSRETGLLSPLAVLLWASVSDEIDKRLTENLETPIRMTPPEWKSGDNLWLIEIVGEPQVASALLKRTAETQWKGRKIKMRTKQADGKVGVTAMKADEAAKNEGQG